MAEQKSISGIRAGVSGHEDELSSGPRRPKKRKRWSVLMVCGPCLWHERHDDRYLSWTQRYKTERGAEQAVERFEGQGERHWAVCL